MSVSADLEVQLLVSVSVIPVLLQSLSLVPPHLLPHLLESLQILASSDLHFLDKTIVNYLWWERRETRTLTLKGSTVTKLSTKLTRRLKYLAAVLNLCCHTHTELTRTSLSFGNQNGEWVSDQGNHQDKIRRTNLSILILARREVFTWLSYLTHRTLWQLGQKWEKQPRRLSSSSDIFPRWNLYLIWKFNKQLGFVSLEFL